VITPFVEPDEPRQGVAQGRDDQFTPPGTVNERLSGVKAQFVAVLVREGLDRINDRQIGWLHDRNGQPRSARP